MPPRAPKVSVYERSDGRFSVRWREHGRQREDRGYDTEEAAEDAAYLVRQRLRTGLPGVRESLTVRELIAAWWDGYVTAGTLGRATRANYKTATDRVLATLGDADATRLTTPSLITWAQDLDASLSSPRLVNECLKVLSSAYQRSIEWGQLDPPNPVRAVPKRKEAPRSVIIPTRSEAARVGITAPTLQHRCHLLIAGYVGLRPGEQIALQWRHIRETTARVEQSMDLKGRFVSTKTDKPRDVPISPSVRVMLKQWHDETRFGKAKDPVFPSLHGQHLHASNWRRNVWYPWREDAGVPHLQWRTFRHYYASELAANGATIMQASRWMGHGSIRTTIDRYGFLFDEDADRVMQRLG